MYCPRSSGAIVSLFAGPPNYDYSTKIGRTLSAIDLPEPVGGNALSFHEPIAVRHLVVRGGAARALIDASSGAQVVVVGARGHGGFTGLLLGSVGQALLHRVACPVAIVRT